MQDLLNPSFVKEHRGIDIADVFQVEDDLDVAVDKRETKHLDDLCDGTVDRALDVGRLESTILNELLVEKIIGVQLD